jgi:hypothetical protein
MDDGQVDAEQLGASFQRCRDRPAQSGSCHVPPHHGIEPMFEIEQRTILAR